MAEHPSSPLAWAELADLADSEGRFIEAFAYAAVAVDLAREVLVASGWSQGDALPWSHEPNRAYLRALDAQRRAAEHLGVGERARRLADELASADPEAPARIASEFTPTQLMSIISADSAVAAGIGAEARTGEPLAAPAASEPAGED